MRHFITPKFKRGQKAYIDTGFSNGIGQYDWFKIDGMQIEIDGDVVNIFYYSKKHDCTYLESELLRQI